MWWALAIGAGFGGNLTVVGSSANVVMVGIAAREGHPIGFWQFTRKVAVVTSLTIAVAAPYLWLRYFVLG
jgi:Na+/H+ antiporter NhaD/arsenite permease-like protein